MLKKFVTAVFIFLSAGQIAPAQNQTDYFAHLQAEHQQVLQKWLAKNGGMRPAVEADASKEDLEAWQRENRNFFPYYSVNDFNQDGRQDFAVLLKIEKKADEGAIVIFNAPFRSPRPAYYERGVGVGQYYLEFMEDVRMLYFTKYETHGFYLKPKGEKYIAVYADEEKPQ
jgi:hypothetical protein